MRDRYLFSADRKSNEYRTILEVTPGHARLITPSAAARALRWIISIVYYGLYTGILGVVWLVFSIEVAGSFLAGWPLAVLTFMGWLAGLLAVGWLADRNTLGLLADSPAQWTDLILMGARSFGTFQEVRARTMRGEEMKLVVDSGPGRFWEAVGLLEGKAPTAA